MDKWSKMVVVFFIGGNFVFAWGGGEFKEEFTATDSGYHFRVRFSTSLCADTVLAILYDFDHVSHYTFSSEEVTLISFDDSEYRVRIQFSRFFYSFTSLFRRTLRGDTVFTHMEEFTQRRALVPDVSFSKGVYTVTRSQEASTVELIQHVRFSGPVNRIYMRMIQGGVKRFRESMLEYIKEKERRLD